MPVEGIRTKQFPTIPHRRQKAMAGASQVLRDNVCATACLFRRPLSSASLHQYRQRHLGSVHRLSVLFAVTQGGPDLLKGLHSSDIISSSGTCMPSACQSQLLHKVVLARPFRRAFASAVSSRPLTFITRPCYLTRQCNTVVPFGSSHASITFQKSVVHSEGPVAGRSSR